MAGELGDFFLGAGAAGADEASKIFEDKRRVKAKMMMDQNLARFRSAERAADRKAKLQGDMQLEDLKSQHEMDRLRYELGHKDKKSSGTTYTDSAGNTIAHKDLLDTYKAEIKDADPASRPSFAEWARSNWGIDVTGGFAEKADKSGRVDPAEVDTIVKNIMKADPWGPNALRPDATKKVYGSNPPEVFEQILRDELSRGTPLPRALKKARGNDAAAKSTGPGEPPVEGAVWSKRYKSWFVQKNGKWNRVDE